MFKGVIGIISLQQGAYMQNNDKNKNDITVGSKLGHYTIMTEPYSVIPEGKKYGRLMIDCLCDCGTKVTILKTNLESVGKIKHYACKSCVKKLKAPMGYRDPKTYYRTHGETKTPLWVVWTKIRGRVKNPTGKTSVMLVLLYVKNGIITKTFEIGL